MSAAAAAATRTAATAVRRPFSFYTQVRSMGRAFEHAPYERFAATMKPQRPDYAKNLTWTAGKVVTYFPIFGAMLGWPVLCKWALDGQIGRL
ncbi:uncharacterized protein TRIVIDRAFT_215469 [Trichoderma virens Gv29-8]|uniref:Uncharacterized protein n=1 Tax=Hypocrea virens (strain Gv29-8 / FGSC 10586) TaxID=413071 RepID=G9MJ97_HYPVG|nr:uncharacterized protein TRIVIDRAFT_215469 [Trichoderma virens Gv29-8]EHK25560.1 hypothetical protein TRIVIDRAFT_215469 [Trichoderma virens Gv29-8]UKZ48619.1 hypothetical protein TrVGV298_002846 [Trichoderma virens]UKZ75157.1 hypothetical protein TrVFT333_002831 [Trichoderma virens FT-333]